MINFSGLFFSSTTQKEDIAIANLKPKKHITYRKPKLNPTVKQASKFLLNTSINTARKTFRSLAKQQSESNETNNRYINIMEAQQSINFLLADIRFRNRRMRRANQEHARLVATGKEDDFFRIAWSWAVDYLCYVLLLILGVIQPIVLILVMLIMRIVLTVFFTALGFYLLYKLITS